MLAGDLEKAGMVEAKYQSHRIGPTVAGHNGGGDLYYTDGEVWIHCGWWWPVPNTTGPPETIPSPAATEIKDQIFQAIANVIGRDALTFTKQ